MQGKAVVKENPFLKTVRSRSKSRKIATSSPVTATAGVSTQAANDLADAIDPARQCLCATLAFYLANGSPITFKSSGGRHFRCFLHCRGFSTNLGVKPCLKQARTVFLNLRYLVSLALIRIEACHRAHATSDVTDWPTLLITRAVISREPCHR